MGPNVGSIEYDARINTGKMKGDAAEAEAIAKKTGDGIGDNTEQGTGRASAALEKFASVARVVAVTTSVALAGGIAAAAKASWDQVSAVQQATVGLNAYEKDGAKVGAVLKDLISYARSDLGVLFNRKDLFESAQSLKIMGDNTDSLVGHVQILSRSVGLGLSNWQDLNLIVGRVGSTGRLTGEDFDNLTKAGYKLDPAIRNTDQSFSSLFGHLEKGIPVDALNGQANTIKGLGIRMETAFRGVGDAILGVDSETSKFVDGGLGDRLGKGMAAASDTLKSFKKPAAEMTASVLSLADSISTALSPYIDDLGRSIGSELLPAIRRLLASPFAQVVGGTFVTAIKVTILAVSGLVKVVSGATDAFTRGVPVVVGITAGFLAYKTITIATTAATLGQAAAQTLLNTAMKLNPVALVIAGAVGITTAYIAATNQTNNSTNATHNLKIAQDLLRTTTDAAKAAQDRLTGALLSQEGSALAVERAQLNYNSAVAQYGPKSLEAREAAYQLKQANDNLAKSNADVRDRTNEVTDAETKRAKAKDAVVKASSEVKNQVDAEANAWMGLGKSINEANAEAGKKPVYGGTTKVPTGFNIPGRAVGGPVSSGSPYLVGENADGTLNKTSELFVPRSAGRIINSKDLQDAMGGSSKVSNTVVNVTLSGIMARSKSDERDIAKSLIRTVNEELSAKGQPILGNGAI